MRPVSGGPIDVHLADGGHVIVDFQLANAKLEESNKAKQAEIDRLEAERKKITTSKDLK